MATNLSEYFETLSERLSNLSYLFPRLREYERIFRNSNRLQQAMSTFYAIVVVFFTKSLKLLQERGIKMFVKSLWQSFTSDFGQLDKELSMVRDEVNEELKLASEQEAVKGRGQQYIEFEESSRHRSLHVTEIQESKRHRTEQSMVLGQAKSMLIQRLVKDDERRRIRLLAKVRSYDYTWSLRIARQKRCEGTGMWLFNRLEFAAWKTEMIPTCLWISGFAGCGKTVLTTCN